MMVAGQTAEDVNCLEVLLGQFTVGKDNCEAEVLFHSRLLRMTRNRLIESLIPLTVGFFAEHGLPQPSEPDMVRIQGQHREIVEALKERNAERLVNALREHYQSYFQ